MRPRTRIHTSHIGQGETTSEAGCEEYIHHCFHVHLRRAIAKRTFLISSNFTSHSHCLSFQDVIVIFDIVVTHAVGDLGRAVAAFPPTQSWRALRHLQMLVPCQQQQLMDTFRGTPSASISPLSQTRAASFSSLPSSLLIC
jgi:hypothetical protein